MADLRTVGYVLASCRTNAIEILVHHEISCWLVSVTWVPWWQVPVETFHTVKYRGVCCPQCEFRDGCLQFNCYLEPWLPVAAGFRTVPSVRGTVTGI